MAQKIKQFIFRSLLIPVSGFLFLHQFLLITRAVNDIVFEFTYDRFGAPLYLTLNTRIDVVFACFAGWMIAHLCFEFICAFGADFRFRRTLATLRYAPLAVFLIAATVVVLYDLAKIEYSKYEIRNYVFSASTSLQKPDIYLHNNYYGWRSNGYTEQEKDLYFAAASEGMANENPFVRARALLMTAQIQDWQSGHDEKFETLIAGSCGDSEQVVRATAEDYLYRRNSNCQKFLSAR